MTVTDEQNLTKALTYTKTVLGITVATYDTLLGYLIKGSVQMIKNSTNIDLLNISEIVETIDGAGQRQVFLETLPISTITKVEYNANQRGTADWQEVDDEKYIVDQYGSLSFSFPLYRGKQNIKITYTTGFTDFDAIPRKYEQLKTAMALIAGNMFNTRKQSGISSESVSGTSIVYDKKAITSDIQQMLDQYKSFAI